MYPCVLFIFETQNHPLKNWHFIFVWHSLIHLTFSFVPGILLNRYFTLILQTELYNCYNTVPGMSHSSSTSSMPICRICQLPSLEPHNSLISPCRCLGSIRYVHNPCLAVSPAAPCKNKVFHESRFIEMARSLLKKDWRPSCLWVVSVSVHKT